MDRENQPGSLQQPWWVGKAKRHHILFKFIIVAIVVALLILGLAVVASRS